MALALINKDKRIFDGFYSDDYEHINDVKNYLDAFHGCSFELVTINAKQRRELLEMGYKQHNQFKG